MIKGQFTCQKGTTGARLGAEAWNESTVPVAQFCALSLRGQYSAGWRFQEFSQLRAKKDTLPSPAELDFSLNGLDS